MFVGNTELYSRPLFEGGIFFVYLRVGVYLLRALEGL